MVNDRNRLHVHIYYELAELTLKIFSLLNYKKHALKFSSLIMYFFGMASFLVVDVIISKYYSIDEVALWGLIKSALMLSSTICIFGLDQVIVRRPSGMRKISRHLALQILLIAGFVSIILEYFTNSANTLFWFLSIFLTALLSVSSAILRGSYFMTMAQFALNGWKLLLLILVIFSITMISGLNLEWIVIMSLFTSALIVVIYSALNCGWMDYYIKKEISESIPSKNVLIADARYFFMLGLSLNISITLEQLTLNMFGYKSESANLLAHISIFIPLIVFLNGFIGFYLGPYMQRIPGGITKQKFNKKNLLFIFVGLFFSLISLAIGCAVFDLIYMDKFTLNYPAAVLIVALGFMRFLYSVPSAYVGLISKSSDLKRYATANIIFIIIALIIFFGLIKAEIAPFIAILICSLINWVSRVIFGYFLIYSSLRDVK